MSVSTRFESLREHWDGYVGDRSLELAIRRALDEDGYGGSLAKIRRVRLAGALRPGWERLYRFEVEAKHLESGERRRLFGLVRDDERHGGPRPRIFDDEAPREELFHSWSDGMITLEGMRARPRSGLEKLLVIGFLAAALLALAGAIFGG